MSAQNLLIELSYFVASILFILGLKGLSHPDTARRGMFMAEFGMLLAVVGTLLHHDIVSYEWIIVGLLAGSTIGVAMGLWVPMTAMPQRTALSHAFGGLAAALVGVSEFLRHGENLGTFKVTALGFEVLLGGITFTGSLMAFAKLQELVKGAPITYRGQNVFNLLLFVSAIAIFIALVLNPGHTVLFYAMCALALVFGVPPRAADRGGHPSSSLS